MTGAVLAAVRRNPRLLGGLPVLAVGVFAGVISFNDTLDLALAHDQLGAPAHLVPLTTDMLIVAGAVMLLWPAAHMAWLGWLCVVPGVGATVFANVESKLPHGWQAATVAAWAAIAFTVATFAFERWLKAQITGRAPATVPAPEVAAPVPAMVSAPAPPPVWANGHAREAVGMYAVDLAAGQVPGIRRIRRDFHLGAPRAKELQEYLAASGHASRNGTADAGEDLEGDAGPALSTGGPARSPGAPKVRASTPGARHSEHSRERREVPSEDMLTSEGARKGRQSPPGPEKSGKHQPGTSDSTMHIRSAGATQWPPSIGATQWPL